MVTKRSCVLFNTVQSTCCERWQKRDVSLTIIQIYGFRLLRVVFKMECRKDCVYVITMWFLEQCELNVFAMCVLLVAGTSQFSSQSRLTFCLTPQQVTDIVNSGFVIAFAFTFTQQLFSFVEAYFHHQTHVFVVF